MHQIRHFRFSVEIKEKLLASVKPTAASFHHVDEVSEGLLLDDGDRLEVSH